MKKDDKEILDRYLYLKESINSLQLEKCESFCSFPNNIKQCDCGNTYTNKNTIKLVNELSCEKRALERGFPWLKLKGKANE